jgi:hypothetical protein
MCNVPDVRVAAKLVRRAGRWAFLMVPHLARLVPMPEWLRLFRAARFADAACFPLLRMPLMRHPGFPLPPTASAAPSQRSRPQVILAVGGVRVPRAYQPRGVTEFLWHRLAVHWARPS